jgi:DNA-binding XRE family transcriptional regulator
MKLNDTKKKLAKDLYVLGNQTQKSIAATIGVTEKTLGKWIEGNEHEPSWKELRDLQSITKKQLLADSYAQLAAVNLAIKANGNVPTKEQYDAKSILGKEIDRLSDSPLAVYTDVFSDFVDWLLRNEPKHVQDFARLSMLFIEQKNSK